MAGFDFNTPQMDMTGFGQPNGGNPFSMGLLAQLAAQNPQLISQVAAAHGIPPPGMGAAGAGAPLGSFLDPAGLQGGAPPTPGAVAPGAPGTGAANPWAALQGFKGPQVAQPIMSGGVAGAQKAPDPGQGISAPSMGPQLQQILQMLMGPGGGAPQPVPAVGNLGSFINGR